MKTIRFGIAVALAPLLLQASVYCNFSTSVPESLGDGWRVANAETARGKALVGTGTTEMASVTASLGSHSVFSFLAKSGSSGTIQVFMDDDVIGSVVVISDGVWHRHCVLLDVENAGEHEVSWKISDSDSSSSEIWMDDVYAGRRLVAGETWSCVDQDDGIVKLLDGVNIGSWITANGTSGFEWSTTDDGFYVRCIALEGRMSDFVSCAPIGCNPTILNPSGAPPADTIVVAFELLPATAGKCDYVCPFVSLDNGATAILVGDYVGNSNAVLPRTADGWICVTNRVTISGLEENENALLGFRARTGANRSAVTVRNISFAFKTLATPVDAGFATATRIVHDVSFGETNLLLGARVDATSTATNSAVTLRHVRTGHSSTNISLVKSQDVEGLWLSTNTVGQIWHDALEAGETNRFEVEVSYESTIGLDTDSPEKLERADVVNGLGTVWINELDLADSWVELAAPSGRVISGWSLRARQIRGEETNSIVLASSLSAGFGNDRFGVGFETFDISSVNLANAVTTTVELVNSSGIVESSREFVWDSSGLWQATGELAPRTDWTCAGEEFGWESETETTADDVNDGQGIQRLVSLPLRFRSNLNNVTITVVAGFTGVAVTNQFVLVDDNPETDDPETEEIESTWYVSELVLEGNDSRDVMPSNAVRVSAVAFGYEGNMEVVPEYQFGLVTNVVEISMEPSVGIETFDLGFERTWTKGGAGSSFVSWIDDEPRYIQHVTRLMLANRDAGWLKSTAGLSTSRGNKIAKLSLDIQATSRGSVADRLVPSLVSPSGSDSISFVTLTDLYDVNVYSATDWVRTTQWLPLSDNPPEVYFLQLWAFAGGSSRANLNFDDIYLSFQDWAGVTNLALEPLTPTAGEELTASFTVVPEGNFASNVTVRLMTRLNGGEAVAAFETNFVELAGAEDLSVTNLLALAGFEGDLFVGVLNVWTETSFDTRNGSKTEEYMRDVSYCPDNASVDEATGIRVVEGEYSYVPLAWGVQRVWVNEVNPNGSDQFVELCGRAGEDLSGWSLVVVDFATGSSASYAIPADVVLAETLDGCGYGFYVFSSASHSGFSLPARGGIQLLDAEGTVRYAYAYAADGEAPAGTAGYVNLGSAGGASLLAVGEGNPANHGFGWGAGPASKGAINEGQSLANGGPVRAWFSAAVSEAGADLAAGAVDLDSPVEYLFTATNLGTGVLAASSGWSTNGSWTASGLSENVRYAFAVETRDALGTEGESVSTNLYTLLSTWTAGASGSATNAVTVTAAIPGLGAGATRWSIAATDGFAGVNDLAADAFEASSPSWTPNTYHTFALSACNGDGVLSATGNAVSAWTRAAVPRAALGAEVLEGTHDIALSLDSAIDAETCRNGNSLTTEYGVRVTLQFIDQASDRSYVVDLSDGTGRTPSWSQWSDFAALFADGNQPVWTADSDTGELAATNIAFEVVARNDDGIETASRVGSAETDGIANAHFDLTVSFESSSPAQLVDGSGGVSIVALLTNPASLPCDLRLEYAAIVDPAETNWRAATLRSAAVDYGADFAWGADPASGYTLRNVSTATNAGNRIRLVWDALVDLEERKDFGEVLFRWQVDSDNLAAPATVYELQRTGAVCLALPAVENVRFTGDVRNGMAKQAAGLPFLVTFDDDTSNLVATATVDGVARTGVTCEPAGVAGETPSRTWTVSVPMRSEDDAKVSATVVLSSLSGALDPFGNGMLATNPAVTVVYDGRRPAPTLASEADGTTTNANTFTVSVTFDEAVNGLAKEDFAVVNGTAKTLAGSGTSYTLTVECASNSLQEGRATTVKLLADKCQDSAGNQNVAADQTISVVYDPVPPRPTLASAAHGTNTNERTFTVSVTFDEAVTGLAKEDFAVVNGTAKSLTGSGTSYTLTVECASNTLQEGQATIVTLPKDKCRDSAGNQNVAAVQTISVVYDTIPPHPTLASEWDGTTTNANTFTVSVTFDEAVTGLEKEDFAVVNGTAKSLAGSGTSYTLTVECSSNTLQEGQATTVTLPEDKCRDSAGNQNVAAEQTISVVYDPVPPHPTLASEWDGTTTNANTFTVSVTFDEAVTGLAKEDFAINYGSAKSLAGSGTSYTLTVECAANALQEGRATTVTLPKDKCQDAAGNQNVAAGQTISVVYDTTQPHPTLASDWDGTTTNANTFTVSVTFDEAVTGLAKEDFAVVNGSAKSLAGSGTSYTLTVECVSNTLQEGQATTVTLPKDKCRDAAGNQNVAAGQTISVIYDRTAPAVESIAVSPTGYVSNAFVTATVTFSEPMQGAASLDVENAVAALQSGEDGDTVFVFRLSLDADGPVSVAAVPSAAFTDRAGNPLAAAFAYGETLVRDATPPNVELGERPSGTVSAGDFAIQYRASDANADAGLSFAWKVVRGAGTPDEAEVASGTGTATDSSGLVASGSGLAEGDYTFTVTAADAARNVSEQAKCEWTVSRERPTCAVTPAAALVQGDVATFTVSFSEEVFDLAEDDFEALGGSVSAFSGSGLQYTVEIRAARPATTVGLAVPVHVCTNALGIGNAAGAAATCEVDYTPPVVGALSASPGRARPGATVEFSFDVEDENLASVTVDGGSVWSAADGASAARTAVHCSFASAGRSFAIVATDKAGNATTNSAAAAADLAIDDDPPKIVWDGVPGGDAVSNAQFAATIETIADDDPDVRFRWAVVEGAPATTNWSEEAGAAVGVAVATNGLESGKSYSFHVQTWDSAGNTNATTFAGTWSIAALPAAGGTPDARGAVDGDVATFTVSWEDSDFVFGEGSYFLRTNNLTVTGVAVSNDTTNATVTVTTADRSPGAFVELVVPAGALGGTNDAVQRVDFQVPVLTYVGRSLLEPNVLEWTLEGVDSVSGTNAFRVCDAEGAAPGEATVGNYAKKTFVKAVVTNVLDNGATTNWTIRVDDGAWDYARTFQTNLDANVRADWSNAVWAADVFVNWRLVYTNATTCLTNAGTAEVNLALPAFGPNNTPANVDNTTGAVDVKPGTWATVHNVDVVSYLRKIDVYPFRNLEEGYIDDWKQWDETHEKRLMPVSYRSGWWIADGLEKVDCFLGQWDGNGREWGITTASEIIGYRPPESGNGTWTNRVDFSTVEATNAWWMCFRDLTQKAKIQEIGAMGAPATYACEKPLPVVSLLDAVHSNGTLRLNVESLTAFRGVETNQIRVKYDPARNGTAFDHDGSEFLVTNRTEKGFEIVVDGVTGEGDVVVTLGGGALWNMLYANDAANVTFHVDFKAPEIASFAGVDPAGNGNAVFTIALSENTSGMEWTNFTASVTNATGEVAGEATIASLVRDGTNVAVDVHADRWEDGATLTLEYAGTLVDACGNATTTNATASVALPVVPETTTARKLRVFASDGGTVNPVGTHWFGADGEAELVVTATPNAGWTFGGWALTANSPDGVDADDGTAATTTIRLVGDTTIATATAGFAQIGGGVPVSVTAGANGGASWTGEAFVRLGGSTNVLFTADPGYRIASVTTNNVAIGDASGRTTFLVALAGLRTEVTVEAAFEKIPDVTVSWTDGEETGSETVAYDADWARTFSAAGRTIESLTVNGVPRDKAAGQSSYALQLFGVIADTDVVVTWAAPSAFTISNLRWTGFDPAEGTLSFTADMDGTAPEKIDLLWCVELMSETTNSVSCDWTPAGDPPVVTVPSDALRTNDTFFAVGLKTGE